MIPCFFASDLHGSVPRYDALAEAILEEHPLAVFLGGDLLPSHLTATLDPEEFIDRFLRQLLSSLRERLGDDYPRVFLILGNDDPRTCEPAIIDLAGAGLCEYIHGCRTEFEGYDVYGYACVPPTPFLNKDWERYDVSRFVDPGCVSPEEGFRTVPLDPVYLHEHTIERELNDMVGGRALERAILLLHTPPHKTRLDRAALDGRYVDHVPMDVHVGSIAVRRLIVERSPYLTLHGHIHESARLTGDWKDRIGTTWMYNAAHDGAGLSLVRFDLDNLEAATRVIIPLSS